MKKIKKVQVKGWLPEQLAKDFRALVKAKYSGIQGQSWEMEAAIRNWMNLNAHRQGTSFAKMNPGMPVYHQGINAIMEELHKIEQSEIVMQSTWNNIKQAIMNVRGNDPRTVRRWMSVLQREKRIKPLHNNIWEIV